MGLLKNRTWFRRSAAHHSADRSIDQFGSDTPRLLRVATTEPPRVRALLGAFGQVLRTPDALLMGLRRSLHPLSRFEFGVFGVLPTAEAWQAKTRRVA